MRILISGASIAGPVLAYWLARHGFDVTVVERAPALRKTGGHAVDLFRPSMEISEKMGVLPRIEALATGTDTLTLYREGKHRPAQVDLTKIVGAASDRHVEIMRDDLSEVYYDAGRDHVEYLFGDSITAISPDGEVTFEHAAARRFDVIVGADGLHSNVRRLVFGDEAGRTRFLGGYLAVVSVPKALAPEGEMIVHVVPAAWRGSTPRAIWTTLGRCSCSAASENSTTTTETLVRQKELLRDAFAGMDPQVDRWLAEARPDARVLLRLDHPAAAGHLVARAGHARRRRRILPRARGGRQHQPRGARRLRAGRRARPGPRRSCARVRGLRAGDGRNGTSQPGLRARSRQDPRSRLPAAVWAVTRGAQLISLLPAPLTTALAKLNTKGVRMYDSMRVKDYTSVPV